MKAEEKPRGITVEQEPRPTIRTKYGKMQNTYFSDNNYVVSPIENWWNYFINNNYQISKHVMKKQWREIITSDEISLYNIYILNLFGLS